MSRQPRVLDKELKEVKRLHPAQLTLNQPENGFDTSMMIVPADEGVELRSFIELYRHNESVGIFRVASVAEAYGDSVEISLVHALRTLEDDVLVGQGTLPPNVADMLAMLINAQTVKHWQLGSVAYAGEISEPIDYNNTNVWDAVKTILTYIPEYRIEADQSAYPWTINIVKRPSEFSCEGRLSRNIANLRVSRDDSQLCTRLHLDNDTRYWDADTIDEWGIVSRTLSTGSDLDENASEEVIEEYLNRKVREYFEIHKNPTLSIEVEVRDLKSATNYDFDHFERGALCRLALPAYSQTFIERIVNIDYPDLLNDPDYAIAQLSNRTEDASARVAGLMVSVTRIEQTVQKTVESLDGTMAGLRAFYDEFLIENENWKHTVSEVSVQLNAIETTLELKANRSELTGLSERLSGAEVLLDGLNADIKLKANLTEVDALGARVSQAEIDIDGANAEIELKVSKNGVIASINATTEAVTIAAKKINLSGYVTSSKLSTELASIETSIQREVHTSLVTAHDARFTNIEFGGAALRLRTQNFVTGVTMPTFYGKYIWYMDDTADVVQQYILTGVNNAGSVTTESLVYCGTN